MHILGDVVVVAEGDGGLQPVLGVDQPLTPGSVGALAVGPGPDLRFPGTEK